MALYIQLSTQTIFAKFLSISSITGGNSVTTSQLTSSVSGLVDDVELRSTIVGLGTLGYISTAGGGGGIATIPSMLSTSQFLTSSIFASTIQTIVLSSQALYVSSFYTATRQATPMFVTF